MRVTCDLGLASARRGEARRQGAAVYVGRFAGRRRALVSDGAKVIHSTNGIRCFWSVLREKEIFICRFIDDDNGLLRAREE